MRKRTESPSVTKDGKANALSDLLGKGRLEHFLSWERMTMLAVDGVPSIDPCNKTLGIPYNYN